MAPKPKMIYESWSKFTGYRIRLHKQNYYIIKTHQSLGYSVEDQKRDSEENPRLTPGALTICLEKPVALEHFRKKVYSSFLVFTRMIEISLYHLLLDVLLPRFFLPRPSRHSVKYQIVQLFPVPFPSVRKVQYHLLENSHRHAPDVHIKNNIFLCLLFWDMIC